MRAAKVRTVAARIRKLSPCGDALSWARGYTSPAKAWRECQRGDWMLWLVGRLSGEPESDKRRKVVLTACACARLALRHTKSPCVLACIKMAEKWARGKATIEQLVEAKIAVNAIIGYSAYAASEAADAAICFDPASTAADAAVYTAQSYYVDDVLAYGTQDKILARCADIVRKHYPKPPRL